jgi:superfamily I DNA and/or RNA helicase
VSDPDAFLTELAALWQRERAAARERYVELRRGTTLDERVARGIALADLTVSDRGPAPGRRSRIWLDPPRHVDLDDLRLGPGDPVRLWGRQPDDALRGVISHRDGPRLCVMVDADLDAIDLEASWNLDAEAPEVTFDRGAAAIERVRAARGELARLRDVLVGARPPHRAPPVTWTAEDAGLDEIQRAAVAAALESSEVALIHGPPGTGKTRTLVEVIRQLVERGERVLAAAASNAAVDNLGERLVAEGVAVVRLGHPARIAPALEDHTLDALIVAEGAADLARQWSDEARSLRSRAAARAGRGASRDELQEMRDAARDLTRDARAELARAEEAVLGRARVILTTCAGAEHPALADHRFDTVIVDEATQSPDPLTLVALARGLRAVLAGDPCQLPPTMIDPGAARAGLATTFFERLLAAGEVPAVMLEVQHRMHADIMRFPSRSMYGGRLVAAPDVAGWTLDDLGAAPDPLRPGAVWLVDTAGTDVAEERTEEAGQIDPSTQNPRQAERVAAEVRRLLSRGVAPKDVAVIAAYHAQVRRLRELLAEERAAGLEVGTVDGFQGREKEAIVVDTVRSNDRGEIGFLGDVRRMNVALSRARRFLLVVADSATLGGHPYYADFVAAMDELDAHGSAWSDDAPPLTP